MKTIQMKKFMGILAAVVTATAAFRAWADDAAATAPAKADETHTGMITAVNPQEHTLTVRGWMMLHKDFNVGDTCVFAQLDKPSANINDLRPGEKVTVSYQDVRGVRIADRVQQIAMTCEGKVTAIDPTGMKVTVHRTGMDKQMSIASDCSVTLLHQRSGVVKDIRPGDHVTVTYETPGDTPIARQISQTSMEFTGNLTAIDLGERTLKAGSAFDSKKFNLSDDCAIVVNGRTDGRLSDLKPDDKLSLSYDEINGVNVVNRIGVLEPTQKSVAISQP